MLRRPGRFEAAKEADGMNRYQTHKDDESDRVVCRILELTRIRSMKQYQLADAIGINASCVSSWKTGMSYPARDTLEKIAVVLDAHIDDLDPHRAIPIRGSRTLANAENSEIAQLRRRIAEQLDAVMTDQDVDKLADLKPRILAMAFRNLIDQVAYWGEPPK